MVRKFLGKFPGNPEIVIFRKSEIPKFWGESEMERKFLVGNFQYTNLSIPSKHLKELFSSNAKRPWGSVSRCLK